MGFRPGARHLRIGLGLVVTVLGTAGCAPAPDPSAPTVEYYRAHRAEREATLRGCANDPGRLAKEPSCINAREAGRLEGIGSLRDLPSMGLPRQSPAAPDADEAAGDGPP